MDFGGSGKPSKVANIVKQGTRPGKKGMTLGPVDEVRVYCSYSSISPIDLTYD